ncbi:acid protease [Polyporus arcularius HHB13444]|uniref:Acid protease n=1 Tax=Polyporus arcularius HHB13444 TaxID=1314778 RepID=A0A5C3P0L8_9APHY|nr:acid protease [Polyporus arcularius HHB13444]
MRTVYAIALLSHLGIGALGASLPTAWGAADSISFTLATSPQLVGHRIYVVNVSVAVSTHDVVLDTGSNDLWVDTTLGAPLVNHSSSSPGPVHTETGISALLEYGVENAYTYALGEVQFASVEVPSAGGNETLVVHNQAFLNVPGTTNITQYGNEGVLGLGPPRGWSAVRDVLDETEWDADPFLATMFEQHPKMQRFFTLSFGPRDTEGAINAGAVTFGAVRPELSAILDAPKLPLMTGQFWDVPSRGFVVDGTVVNLSGSGTDELRFILDSGVYATFAPPEYLRAIYSPVPGSFLLEDGTWSVPCDTRMNVSVLLGETAYGIHPVDMTEVYGLEEEDGTWKPLCKGLFQSNLDTEIPFLIGLNVLRNLHVLHHYGGVAGNPEPYVQIVQATDMAQASAEFAAMNTARIDTFLRVGEVTAETSSVERPMESVGSTVVRTPEIRRTMRGWYVDALLLSSACFAVLYAISRWFRLRARCASCV